MTDKKKLITLVSLLVVLALFLAAFILMKSYNENNPDVPEEETAQAETVKVTEMKADDMTNISYVYEGNEYSFTRNTDTTWSLDSDSLFPVKSNTIDTMATTVSAVEAEKTVENGETESFGFDEPSLTVTGKYSDGTEISFMFGKTNPYNELVYLKDTKSGKIYMVKSTVLSPFKVKLTDLIKTDTLPSDINDDFITALTITDETGASKTIDPEMGMNLTEAMELFYKLEFPASNCKYTTEDKLADYGIGVSAASVELSYKSPETVINEDGSSTVVQVDTDYKIVFGNHWVREETLEDADGEPYVEKTVFYYYTVPGSTIVYSINENDYEKLMHYVSLTDAELNATDDTTAAQ